jgi:hypothetical protein
MGILIFFGIFICRSFNGVLGALIIALAAAFLFFTESKSPLALLPLVLLFSLVFVWLRSPIAKLVTVLSIPLIIGILTSDRLNSALYTVW